MIFKQALILKPYTMSIFDARLLPLDTEIMKLQNDLQLCLQYNWPAHYNTNDYSGNWNSIALYSSTGSESDVFAVPDAVFKPTPALSRCAYFTELLDALEFEKEAVRLLQLEAGSEIRTHRDRGLAYRFGSFRLHIPIITDADVEFEVNDTLLDMQPGQCWYADFDKPHSVNNRSSKHRVHLVIDGKRNAWTNEWFARAGYYFLPKKPKP
jgi:aspartyl/asparaginyl beta-hydroxylase (cupin superfamily)